MDVVGSEIGLKMRSAIKAKLTELGCYVDDELPDYVMVMVANKRTRVQMEDDLQLFLGGNTELFVNWLHQVLKKLQEVTVSAPVLKLADRDKNREALDSTQREDSKERKSKERKLKQKKSDIKKGKKKDKEKLSRKKEEKKIHKSKKKSRHHEIIRPNIPPLLMNIEKESEPSITDVFAGQILKNHGITLDHPKEDSLTETKPVIKDLKRSILPIIDPATISSQLVVSEENLKQSSDLKEDQIKEINSIEAKIQGLKQKLTDQLDSISDDDDDFLNIRTEAEELMNDFAEDVFQEISQEIPAVATPPLKPAVLQSPAPVDVPGASNKDIPESLPQIELQLPKRPMRERLGVREESKKLPEKERIESPERFTPEREPEVRHQKSAKSRLGSITEASKKYSASDDSSSDKPSEISSKTKLTSKVSSLCSRRAPPTCASVVRVRPRPRGAAPASSLLLRAVADAHKSLLNTPNIKMDTEKQQVKKALVLPIRRCIDAKNIVIEVPTNITDDRADSISLEDHVNSDDDKSTRLSIKDKEEYIPTTITKRIVNNEYTQSKCNDRRTTTRKDDTLVIETINIHNTKNADKKTQFIVTMDGYHPNAFLAKKLQTEGLLADDEEIMKVSKEKPPETEEPEIKQPVVKTVETKDEEEYSPKTLAEIKTEENLDDKKKLCEDSSPVHVVTKENEEVVKNVNIESKEAALQVRKRKASPIIFDVNKKVKTSRPTETEHVRERTESVSSDGHVTVTTVTNTHKYDAVPPLSAAERKASWCRMFPACRYGAACAFTHPRCKFLASCTRRTCIYSHPTPRANITTPVPARASHVVPVTNYKSISPVIPNMCKFYPNCVNPSCHFYHPKPCRYGNGCANKLECNFYHSDMAAKWRYPVQI